MATKLLTIKPQNASNDSPFLTYDIYYTATRSGANVTYKIEARGRFTNHAGTSNTSGWLGKGTGCSMTFKATLGGKSATATFKSANSTLELSAGQTKTVSVSITISNSSGAAQKVTMSMTSDYFTSGAFSNKSATIPAITPYRTAPSAPTNLKNDVSWIFFGGKIKMTWTAGKAGTNNPVKGYNIQYRRYSNNAWGSWAGNINVTSTTYTHQPSAEPGKVQFRIRTTGTYSNSSYVEFSAVTIYPSAPQMGNITLDPSTGKFREVNISWSAATENSYNKVTKYEVYAAEKTKGSTSYKTAVLIATVQRGSTLSFTWKEGTNGSTYKFFVRVHGSNISYPSGQHNYTDSAYSNEIVKMSHGIYFLSNGTWAAYEVYAVVDGKWVNCIPYGVKNGVWVEGAL